jgi:hypothetical protein
MPKALELSDDALIAPPIPKAAQVIPAVVQPMPPKKGRAGTPKPEPREPLQVRWPSDDVKAAKLAAIQLDFPTVSDFMLTCFHAYMKTAKHGKSHKPEAAGQGTP